MIRPSLSTRLATAVLRTKEFLDIFHEGSFVSEDFENESFESTARACHAAFKELAEVPLLLVRGYGDVLDCSLTVELRLGISHAVHAASVLEQFAEDAHEIHHLMASQKRCQESSADAEEALLRYRIQKDCVREDLLKFLCMVVTVS